jgi:hypothetical protein
LEILRAGFLNEVELSEVKFTGTVLLRFQAMEQLWTAEHMNKAPETFRESSSIKQAADPLIVPRICLCCRKNIERNTRKP